MLYRRLTTLGSLALLLILITSTSAAPSANWGVDVGDTAIYWIDEATFTPSNDSSPIDITALLGESNRTNIVLIKSKGASFLNYTLGLTNGTNIMDDQQVRIEETSIEGLSLLIPAGDLPLVLPLSVQNANNNYSNYLQYLSSSASIANTVIASLVSSGNLTNVEDVTVTPNYRSDLFNISAVATLKDLSSFSIPTMNFTDLIDLGENLTINKINLDLDVSYNSTDGMLMEFDLDATADTTQTLSSGAKINNTIALHTTIIRQSYTSIDQILANIDDNISSAADAPLMMIGVLPTFLLLRKFRD